jgi:hypothetical protein
MSKNANRAIDFQRLFAVKDQLAKADSVAATAFEAPHAQSDVPPTDPPPVGDIAPPQGEGRVTELFVAERPASEAPSAPVKRLAETVRPGAIAPRPELVPPPASALAVDGEAVGPLRIGMPKALHHRVRAAAAMACKPPVMMVREVLEQGTPHFDAGESLTDLGEAARGAFPQTDARRTVDVRMQVHVSEDLHQRLVQLAALRAQTLGACLLDALDHQLPR